MKGPIHPGLAIYRAARAKGKAAAIMRRQEAEKREAIRQEVLTATPNLANDPNKLEAVIDGVIKSRKVKKTKVGKNKRGVQVQQVPTFAKKQN